MPQGQTTPEKNLSNPWFGKGFCDPQQYKSAIERCENGYHSLELGIDIYKRLHKIFENHSAALREWSKSSIKQISDSKETGSNKLAWLNTIRAVEKLTERNNSIVESIQHKVVDSMTSFKNEHYGKSFFHVRQIKEFDKEFKKTQKIWLECLKKISEAKQEYHDAARKLHQAKNAEDVIKTDVGSSEEERKKVEHSVKRRSGETTKFKTDYENVLKDTKSKQEKYENDMLSILQRTDVFEKERLEHFKSIITSLKESTLIKHETFDDSMNESFSAAIAEHKSDEDIKHFNTNYGSEKKTVWPVFEEFKA